MTNLDSLLKSRDITLSTKVHLSQGYSFSSGHLWMWELDYKESWVQKDWRFWTVVLEKTLESPLDCKEIQPVHPKGDQSWVFSGRTDVEAETPILWPPHAMSWVIGKDPDAGKDWGQEEKGMTEDEMVGLHHRLNGHGFVWTLGVVDGQGGLACCGSWGRKESDTTEGLNWTEQSNSKTNNPPLHDRMRKLFLAGNRMWVGWQQVTGARKQKSEQEVDSRGASPETVSVFSKVQKIQTCSAAEYLLETSKGFKFWNWKM